jgi:hypothetical protein
MSSSPDIFNNVERFENDYSRRVHNTNPDIQYILHTIQTRTALIVAAVVFIIFFFTWRKYYSTTGFDIYTGNYTTTYDYNSIWFAAIVSTFISVIGLIFLNKKYKIVEM